MELVLQSLFGLHVQPLYPPIWARIIRGRYWSAKTSFWWPPAPYWLSWLYWKTDFELCPPSNLRCILSDGASSTFGGAAPLLLCLMVTHLLPLYLRIQNLFQQYLMVQHLLHHCLTVKHLLHLCLMVLAPPASPNWWYSTSCTSFL